MNKELITEKQALAIMIMFTLGSTLVLGAGSSAKNDVWLALLLAMVMAIPVLLIYCRLQRLYPDKNLYEIFDDVFGNIVGKLMSLIFIWYLFHLGSLVIRNFTEFIVSVSLPETPQNIIGLFMIVLCIWAVKAGVEVIGRWTSILLPITAIVILAVTLLFIPIFDYGNIKPILYNGFGPVFDSAFSVFAFPFSETVIFLTFFNQLTKKEKVYKVYFLSWIISGLFILLVSVRTLLSLGVPNMEILFFPTYASVRLLNIINFIERIEISVAIVFLFAGFIKISVCLYGAAIGTAHLLGFSNYRKIVAPLGLTMLILSIIIYKNTAEMFQWNDIYKYYAFTFEVFMPVVTYMAAVARKLFSRKKRPA